MLVWAFANSLMEELWFRGTFLKKLNPFLSATAAGVVTSQVFWLALDCACAAGDPAVTGLTPEVEQMADAIVESIAVNQ
jgi:hypothetical protein